MSRPRLLGCASLCVVALTSSAFAQPTVQVPEIVISAPQSGSLTSPNTEAARRDIQQTPGAVEVVPDTAATAYRVIR